MNYIETLYELRNEFQQLKYKDMQQLDKLSNRLKLYMKKLFGENSDYIKKFSRISFLVMYAPSTDDAKIAAWESGKYKTYNLIDTMIEDLELDITKPPTQVINLNKSTKVFVVHGRDDLAKIEVARFLEKLGIEAIILHEQTNGGATIIEKFEQYSDVGFAVILYTPCDTGKYKDDKMATFRARQNVVFEHGYFIGKIGRKNVLALVKDDVEKPSDIDGVVYQPMDNSGAWKFKLAKELQNCNFDIDMNKISI